MNPASDGDSVGSRTARTEKCRCLASRIRCDTWQPAFHRIFCCATIGRSPHCYSYSLSSAVQATRKKVSIREGALNGERYESRTIVESAALRLGAHHSLTCAASGKQSDRAWTADRRPER
jgi:hypothetical protein